jgi:hypothetical protein
MNILEWFTTETAYSASFLDIHVILDTNGQLSTRLYDKRDDFIIAIINFPHLDSNISFSPAYGGYISQLICYARACSLNSDFSQFHRILSIQLLNQGYLRESSHLIFQDGFRKISISCGKVFCQLRIYDERWHWKLDLGSKLTIVSLLCLTMSLYNI